MIYFELDIFGFVGLLCVYVINVKKYAWDALDMLLGFWGIYHKAA